MEEEIFVELKRIISENRRHLCEMWSSFGGDVFVLRTRELKIDVLSTTVSVLVFNTQKKFTLDDEEKSFELFNHCKDEFSRHRREGEAKKLLSILKGC